MSKLFILLILVLSAFANAKDNSFVQLQFVSQNSFCAKKKEIYNYYRDCLKWQSYTLEDVEKYINKLGLEQLFKLKMSDKYENRVELFFDSDYTVQRDNKTIYNLIKFHNDAFDITNKKVIKGLPYEILRYFVKYAVEHENAYLFNSLLDGTISSGNINVEYLESYNEEAIIPLLLNYPNVDFYISDYKALKYADILLNYWTFNGGPSIQTEYKKFNQENIDSYKELQKKLQKQSKKLSLSFEIYFIGLVLIFNNVYHFGEFTKLIYEHKNLEETLSILRETLKEKNLLNEYNLYRY